MGKSTSNQNYRDDPDAVSMHTTPDDYEYARPSGSGSDDLPSYAESEELASDERENEQRAANVARLRDDYAIVPTGTSGWHTQTLGKKGSSKEVSARMDPRLSDPAELLAYADKFLQHIPPKPLVCISGWHWETVRRNDKKEKNRVTDFDITLNLSPYLNSAWRNPRVATSGEKTYRGSWRKTRAPGATQDIEVGVIESKDLRAWVEDFSTSKSTLKIFRVSRSVPGLDVEYLRNTIEQLVRHTNYRGHIDFDIVVEDRAVDIYSNHWINSWRTGWQRWIFYLSFLWIFTWPLLYFLTKRWAVFNIEWPFSVAWPERGEHARRFATISEQQWFQKHEHLIRRLVLDKFQGEATDLPLEDQGSASRTPSAGNATIDSAIPIIQSGTQAWNVLQRGLSGRDFSGWGGDR